MAAARVDVGNAQPAQHGLPGRIALFLRRRVRADDSLRRRQPAGEEAESATS